MQSAIPGTVQQPDPTPDEIRERCAEIRRHWAERQWRVRAGLPPVGRSICLSAARIAPPTGRRSASSTEEF